MRIPSSDRMRPRAVLGAAHLGGFGEAELFD